MCIAEISPILYSYCMPTSHRIHFFHLVWSTKGRKELIVPHMQEKLYAHLGNTIRKSGGSVLEIGGVSNHLHLLIELSNLDHFTALIRNAKSSSSQWVKQEFPDCQAFAWQDGYGSFSVSYSQLVRTRAYIKKQKQYHQNHAFEEEYIKLLNLHKVKFDERYVFD